MTEWKPNLKYYPHFDDLISIENVMKLVSDPNLVSKNSFYPFMRYEQRWQPFRGKKDKGGSAKPDKKSRPIRFASRRDAYILSYYRHLLSEPYENLLDNLDLTDSVIAYRKLKNDNGSGKSNIDFAGDAFGHIRNFGNCAAVALDISSFFESLDHKALLEKWCRVLGISNLPNDHRAVFDAVTKYAVVDRDKVYDRLGITAQEDVNGRERAVYKIKFEDMPKKLCSNSDFREKICGRGGKYKSLVDNNRKPYGIPQGSPISDMLANIYLIDFDVELNKYCRSRGGIYFRYSDDIMIIIPGGDVEAIDAAKFAKEEIRKHGAKLSIKDRKTSAISFKREDNSSLAQSYKLVSGQLGKNGLEYLGFRYDGREIWVRDATLSKLYRKISAGIKAECSAHIKRYPNRNLAFLLEKFDFSSFFQRYGRVENFDSRDDVDTWTFWTYARRATRKLGAHGRPIPRQLRRFKLIVKTRVCRELTRRLR